MKLTSCASSALERGKKDGLLDKRERLLDRNERLLDREEESQGGEGTREAVSGGMKPTGSRLELTGVDDTYISSDTALMKAPPVLG